jgi:DNA primase
VQCGEEVDQADCGLEGGLESLQHSVAGADAGAGAKLMATGWVNFGEVKAAVSMRSVLEDYGVMDKVRGSGRERYRGRCPIHRGEGRDAFHAHLGKNVFHCFACGAGGNVVDLVAELEQCSVREAALRLQRRYMTGDSTAAPRQSGPREGQLVTEKRKGNPVLAFSLPGLVPEHPYVSARGLSPETASRFAIGFHAGPGIMTGRLAIPIHDEHGRLVAYCGRSIAAEPPRYRFPAGFHKSALLFNYHRAADGSDRRVVVVEGFFDCMRVYQAGFAGVVALMGAALSQQQADLLTGRFTEIILMLDGDPAGQAGARDATARLAARSSVRQLILAPGRQPDAMSDEEIRQALKDVSTNEKPFTQNA